MDGNLSLARANQSNSFYNCNSRYYSVRYDGKNHAKTNCTSFDTQKFLANLSFPCRRNDLLSNLGQFRAHLVDSLLVSLNGTGFLEDGASGNHHINTGFSNFLDVVNLNTSIDFQSAVNSGIINELAGFSGFIQNGRDEGLSSETRVDRHEQDDVELVGDIFGGIQAGGRVEDQSGLASTISDQLERTVDVASGFGVESDVRGTCINEVTDGSINGGNHQVNVNWGGNTVITKSLADHRSDGQVGYVVVVHNVKVNNVGSSLKDIVDFLTKAAERIEGAMR